jgi:hypothetical protein
MSWREVRNRFYLMSPYLKDFPNHQRVRKALESILHRGALTPYDEAVKATCRCYLRLAQAHLRIVRRRPVLDWRTRVSRAYYASYNASRAVRFFVYGQVANDVEDHKRVGELPNDFPDRDTWSTRLTDMRVDRNTADYDPWPDSRVGLKSRPEVNAQRAREFWRAALLYLKARGVQL